MPDYVVVLLNSVISFVILFIIAKMLGKKQIAELSFIDYVVGISIGSIVANWSTDLDTPWQNYIIALVIYFIFPISITILERKTLSLKAFLRGRPIIIIENGKFDYKNLKKSKLDVNDVLGMCRDKGYFSLSEIAYAIFETNGNLSVMPVGKQRPTVIDDFDIKAKKAQLEKYVIIDGKIDYSYLKMLNKDEKWLLNRLQIKTKKQLKNILIAFYDVKTDNFKLHYKKRNSN